MNAVLEPITQFITMTLVQLYTLTGDLGLAIIVFTVVIRSLLIPLTLPSLKAQNKMKELKPELDKLKAKHKQDKKALQQAQLELYQRYNVNPLAGCIPQLVQIGILIILYQTLVNFLAQSDIMGVHLEPTFLWLNLGRRDQLFVIPLVAAATQLVLSLMIAPGAEVKDAVPNVSASKKVQKQNEKEEDIAEMAASMQQQMMIVMPIMTGVIAAQFPSGLGLYWIVTTVFSIGQQYFISGWGGLTLYAKRALALIQK